MEINEISPVLYSVKEVAALLDCSTREVYRLRDARKVPAPIKLGGMVRWIKTELDQWLANRCRPVESRQQFVAQHGAN